MALRERCGLLGSADLWYGWSWWGVWCWSGGLGDMLIGGTDCHGVRKR